MRSFILLFFLCACALPGRVIPQDETRLRDIQAWIAANSEYEATETLPAIRVVPMDVIRQAAAPALHPVAIYYHPAAEIWVSEDFDTDKPADLVVLVHEMVHHMQQGLDFPCRREMETEAYRLMDKYAVDVLGDVHLVKAMGEFSWSCPPS